MFAVGHALAMRRTQEERSETTRRKLVEATARCLSRDGYQATTTTRIAREAGVSRGAQLHHYPTRADLVRATIRHVFARRVAEFRAAVGDSTGASLASLVAPLWEAASAPDVFLPWLELTVAGRSNPEIAQALAEVTHEIRAETTALAAELGLAGEALVAFAFALLDGLALQQLGAPDPGRRDRILEVLRHVAQIMEERR